MKNTTYIFPAWFVVYHHNGDPTGLTKADEAVAHRIYECLHQDQRAYGAEHYCIDVPEDEPEFNAFPDFNALAGDCYTLEVTFFFGELL